MTTFEKLKPIIADQLGVKMENISRKQHSKTTSKLIRLIW